MLCLFDRKFGVEKMKFLSSTLFLGEFLVVTIVSLSGFTRSEFLGFTGR